MIVGRDRLTESRFFNLFGCESKNRQQFNHYFYEYLRHSLSEGDLCYNLQSIQEYFDAFKNFDKSIVFFIDVLDRLEDLDIVSSEKSADKEGDTHCEKYTDSRKDVLYGRGYLEIEGQNTERKTIQV